MKEKAPDIRILTVREQKVVLDADLARVYGVPTRTLNQALRRNKNRFPRDFAFQLSGEEYDAMRSQIVIASVPRSQYEVTNCNRIRQAATRFQLVAASLCRGAASHGDRATWLHLRFRAEATGDQTFGTAGDDQLLSCRTERRKGE